MKVLVIGAGAIGSIVGGYLSNGDREVILADLVESHVQAMNEHGLLIDGVRGNVRIPVVARLPEQLEGLFDVVFLAVKSQHTRSALITVLKHIHRDSVVVSLQNGLANKTIVAGEVGEDRTIGAMVRLSAGYTGPGHVTQQSEGMFVVGHLDGSITERVEAVQRLLAEVAPTEVSDNLYGWLWAKEMFNSFGLVSTVAGATKREALQIPGAEDVVAGVMLEYANIAKAEGIKFEAFSYLDPRPLLRGDQNATESLRRDIRTMAEQFGDTKGGIYRDIVVRKVPIELEYTAGEILRIGKRHRIQTPILDRLIEMIFAIERGELAMKKDNVTQLVALA